jgi:hypothetical protein
MEAHEWSALYELVDASDDGQGGEAGQLPCVTSPSSLGNASSTFSNSNHHMEEKYHGSGSPSVTSGQHVKTRRYWTRRLWAFLCKVRELKSVPKQEKMLDDKGLYLSWTT